MDKTKELVSADNFMEYSQLNGELNRFISEQKSYLREDLDTQKKARDKILFSSFNYHYNTNKFYRELCDTNGITPQIVARDGAESIPLIPINLFKNQNSHVLLTKKLSEIEFELRSTGTSGIPSVSRRDKDTVDHLCQAFSSLYREYFEISTGCGLFLCPSPAEMPEMGMVKAFNFLSGMLDDRVYLVERYSFRSEEAIQYLNDWQDRFDRHIIGPPFMIHRLLKYLENKQIRLKLDPRSKIIMLGGWKRFTGEQIPRDSFDDLCIEYLGVEKKQIRDMYGLVECNFLAIECEHGNKHVPPWVKIVIRDVKSPDKVITQLGKGGLITILDPTSHSYPCFIQTEDVGRVDIDGTCPCGRTSQTIMFQRRVEGAELGCCAINMEKFMEDSEISLHCEL